MPLVQMATQPNDAGCAPRVGTVEILHASAVFKAVQRNAHRITDSVTVMLENCFVNEDLQ